MNAIVSLTNPSHPYERKSIMGVRPNSSFCKKTMLA